MPVVFQRDESVSVAPGRVVFDEPSPYAAIVQESQDFQRRAAANTLENIGQQVVRDGQTPDVRVPVVHSGAMGLDIPAPFAQAILENAPRVAAPLGAAMSLTGVGALPGAAIMAGAGTLGELGSQVIEKEVTGSRDAYSLPQLATAGLLSVAPPLRLEGVASPLIRGGIRALEGAGYGAAAPVLEAGFRGEIANPEDVLRGGLGGGLLGTPFGALELARGVQAPKAAKPAVPEPPPVPKSAKILAEPTAKPPSVANIATEVGTQTEGSPYALQGKLNEMTAVQSAPTPPVIESPLPVREDAPITTADIPARGAAELKAAAIEGAVKNPETEFLYTVFRPGDGLPEAIQVDAIEGGRNTVSSNPADLRKAGGDIPDVPAWVPQGRYTLEEIKTFIKQGEPNALPIQSPDARLLRAGQPEVELPRVAEGDSAAKAPAREAGAAPSQAEPQGLSEAEFLRSQTNPPPPVEGRSPEAIRAAALRRSQRGAVSEQALLPAGGAVAGGTGGFVLTDREPGESDEEFQARRLRNAALSAAGGAAGAYALGALAKGAQAAAPKRKAPLSPRTPLPEPEAGQGIRQTAEKVIQNREYPEQLRKTLAEDPDILYDKFALSDLADRVAGASVDELNAMRGSSNIRERLGAIAELANRYSLSDDPALQKEGAALYSQLAQNLTNPAQLLGLGKLVKTPSGYVTAINETLKQVDRTLSQSQETALTKLAAESIKAEQELSRAQRIAEQDFTDANEAAYRAAQQKNARAKLELDNFVHQVAPESWGDITSKIIQGNLLTPLSLVANVFGNVVYQPVRRGSSALASAIDEIYSAVAGKDRVTARLNPLPSVAELKAAGEGIKVGAKELLTGPGEDSYVKAEIQRGFRPVRSLVQSFTGEGLAVRKDGTVALNDRAKKFIEGTLGIASEVMFRFLSLGDKPFRRAAEVELLLEQARLKGLKGRDLQKFMEFPDKATQDLLDTEGRKAIFSQENKFATRLNALLDSGLAEAVGADKIPALKEAIKVFGRTVVPFRQFPINYVNTALNFAAPELALGKAIYYGAKGDRRKALQNIGEGVLGTMIYGAANYLWDNGIISEPTDKEAKQRSVQYEQMGPQRINITGLNRALDGGDGRYQLGDLTMDWGRLGIPSANFYVFTRNAANERKDSARTGENRKSKNVFATLPGDRLSAFPGMATFALDQSFLQGTASLLEAMRNPDPDGQELQNWATNTFRAVSSIAVPNSVEALARAEYKYIPELKGDSLPQTLKNVWDFKTLQLPEGDRHTLKRDLWGQPIQRTPDGKNPYVAQFLDVTRAERKQQEPFKQTLIDLYQQTESPDVYPSIPQRNITLEGITAKLLPRDYDHLQQYTGEARRMLAEQLILNPAFSDPQTLPEAKILALQQAYQEGAKIGRQQLLGEYGAMEYYFPDLAGQTPGPQSRVEARDPKARARLKMLETQAP